MSDKIKVSKIRIEIGDVVLDLSPKQMRELRDVLDATFPTETRFLPGQPYVIERPARPWSGPYWRTDFSCGGAASEAMMCLTANAT